MHDVDALVGLLAGRRTLVLSGAGMSTDSGIPDYRGARETVRPRRPRASITYSEFMRSDEARRRYWARSFVGWRRVAAARPNAAHRAVAALERTGAVNAVVTQNVDGLHRAAGSRSVVALHGRLDRVRCTDCGARRSRSSVGRRLAAANPTFDRHVGGALPDGDTELATTVVERFHVVDCDGCGGVLKPDVVFFGENVPTARVTWATRLLGEAQALLVVGTSLTVYSGRRFVVAARRDGLPVAIVNRGPTRGDTDAAVRVDGGVGDVLPALAERLTAPTRTSA